MVRIFRRLASIIFFSYLFSSIFMMNIGKIGTNVQSYPRIDSSYNDQYLLIPTIISVNQTPKVVEYFNQVNVTAKITDTVNIASVKLFFKADAQDWQTAVMSNISAEVYSGMIPPQAWDTSVKYYVNVTDIAGQSIIDDNQSSYYSYSVIDSIAPRIRILSPHDGETVINVVLIQLEFQDFGSGFNRSEVYIDGISVVNGTAEGITFEWALAEGPHTIEVFAWDHAGVKGQEMVQIYVQNLTPAIPGFTLEAIVLGIILATGVIITARLQERKQ